jgi:hypothetical protein
MSKRAAIGQDECGDEIVILMEPGQTLDDIREMYVECRFSHIEDPVKDQDYYSDLYGSMDSHELYMADQQW